MRGLSRFGSCQNYAKRKPRSEEHTSELQSRLHLVCRLLLEKTERAPGPANHKCRPAVAVAAWADWSFDPHYPLACVTANPASGSRDARARVMTVIAAATPPQF